MPATLPVWDGLVRLCHVLLAASVLLALLTGWFSGSLFAELGEQGFEWLHHGAGYLALGLVLLRSVWGCCGSAYARFRQFVRGPRAGWRYLRLLLAGREPRYIGHNPLGGWMVLALLAFSAALGLSGWLYTSDWLWGYAWLEQLHAALALLIGALIAAHVAGVLFTSWRHRENLIAAMINGRKRAAEPDDIS
ncbi:cytochrome b/b6 domain-containing protein [Paucibacter sp. APW11]|uniref:Cytochrome b/b6 domain-containing protein n=1 Tax=Roseateles aquae TaxID=3077235 RepID=A0ABU3P6T9_9BURK|nr:cytochrome b/b6 domain-containing protein [Paucibacter sp. APW11]MDT8998283.1 cytochrome b/b6 domain-containing protein [Paucibacter sp. APW11]